jgi:phytoene dehydrogenase-like protein
MPDVVVVGAGHNGLVAAARLARAGLSVTVCEATDTVGGACRTEHPFPAAPQVAASTGAYLLGLMPPELLAALELRLPLRRRDPHYLLPARAGRPALVLGGDAAANAAALSDVFTAQDARADAAAGALLGALREDLAPSWLAEALPVEQTAETYVRPALRAAYVELVRGSAVEHLRRVGFVSDELIAMFAATDGMPGSALAPDEPGTGHNLLVHSMCRLPGSGGTWMAVDGGMGTVTAALADVARTAGAQLRLGTPVAAVTGDPVDGVALADGSTVSAHAVVAAVDPYRLSALAGTVLDPRWSALPGLTMKINLALAAPLDFGVPLPGAGTTVHLLPDPVDGSWVAALADCYRQARAGLLPDQPAVEVYAATGLATGVFVQGVPAAVAGSSWADARDGYAERILDLVAVAAPGLRESLQGVMALAPPDIEAHFGITGGHIFHLDNSLATVDRLPLRPGAAGLYAGAAGCHPAGSVIGAAGWIAAGAVRDDLDVVEH